jgi:Flp pilus assembly protein TadB
VDLEKGVDDMTLPKTLQSPERDVLLVSALISILVVLAFTDWGILAYVVTGLVFAALFLVSAIANARQRRATHL